MPTGLLPGLEPALPPSLWDLGPRDGSLCGREVASSPLLSAPSVASPGDHSRQASFSSSLVQAPAPAHPTCDRRRRGPLGPTHPGCCQQPWGDLLLSLEKWRQILATPILEIWGALERKRRLAKDPRTCPPWEVILGISGNFLLQVGWCPHKRHAEVPNLQHLTM